MNPERRYEFLSEDDLDLKNLTWVELLEYWDLWLHQAQITNDVDQDEYSHGVFLGPKEHARVMAGRKESSQ